jgi:hypothetical protein
MIKDFIRIFFGVVMVLLVLLAIIACLRDTLDLETAFMGLFGLITLYRHEESD